MLPVPNSCKQVVSSFPGMSSVPLCSDHACTTSQFVPKSGSLLVSSTRASSSPATLISSRRLWEWPDSTFFLSGNSYRRVLFAMQALSATPQSSQPDKTPHQTTRASATLSPLFNLTFASSCRRVGRSMLSACRSIRRYRRDQSQQIPAAPRSDPPAQCERETPDAMSYPALVAERSYNARQHRPQTRG